MGDFGMRIRRGKTQQNGSPGGLQDREPGLALTLIASAPLLLLTGDVRQGFILGLAAALALAVCGIVINLCHHWVPVSLRHVLLLMVAAAVGSATSVILSALAWETWQALRPALPYLLFNSLVFSCLEQDCLGRGLRRTLSRLARVACCLLVLYPLYGFMISFIRPQGLAPAGLLFLLAGIILLFRFLCRHLPGKAGSSAGEA